MKILGIFLAAALSFSAQAGQQPELPLNHPDDTLVKAYPGDNNTRPIELSAIRSKAVRDALKDVDLAFEMGDGYYDTLKSALYMVFGTDGKVIGYMEAALLSYTEDDDLFLVAAFVNTSGIRIGDVHDLTFFGSPEDEELQDLPVELRP
jgi:hypothetical protein